MTAKEFENIVGYEPYQDDLERANCPEYGTLGHKSCGVCEHGKPVFCCQECFIRAGGIGEPVKYIKQ